MRDTALTKELKERLEDFKAPSLPLEVFLRKGNGRARTDSVPWKTLTFAHVIYVLFDP